MSFPPRLTRTVDLYGPVAMQRLRASGAVVVGLGGVGAHTAVALARTGIGRLHLIDLDTVTVSSLNRHPCAGPVDVGQPKTTVLARFLDATCPDTTVTTAEARVTSDTLDALLPAAEAAAFGLVIDAIDSVVDKVALVVHAARQGRHVVCSAGAAGKVDPGLIRSGRLADTTTCPLVRKLRKGVRQAGLDPALMDAVWSAEAPRQPVTAAPGEHLPHEPGVTRRQPSNMMLPGMLGYALAALAINAMTTPPPA